MSHIIRLISYIYQYFVNFRRKQLKYRLLSEVAITPSQGSVYAAGLDLHSPRQYVIKPMERILIYTDLEIELPSGCYGRIAPRSSLAIRSFVHVGGGVVDADYQGNIGVVLFNFGRDDFHIKRGDKIAQLICEQNVIPDVIEMSNTYIRLRTQRGSYGFGSTGR